MAFLGINENHVTKESIDIWLVVEPYPSEKDKCSSIGMMTFPTVAGKNKIHVPNHQAVLEDGLKP